LNIIIKAIDQLHLNAQQNTNFKPVLKEIDKHENQSIELNKIIQKLNKT